MPVTRSAAHSVPLESNSRAPSPLTAIPDEPSGILADLENPDFPTNPRTSTLVEDQSSPNLAQAIMLMTGELRCREAPSPSKRASAKEPDTFDGSDARKLNNFILLCNLYHIFQSLMSIN
jgi:hypothetical protein